MATSMATDQAGAVRSDRLGTDERLIVGLLTLVGLVVCLVQIGQSSLWLDEAFSLAGSGDLARSWSDRGGSMGLYYTFLSVWTDETGTTTWIRLPSAVFAAATVPFLYLVAREVSGRTTAAIATSLLVVSWGFVRYGQEARSYSLVLLLVTASWWAFVRLVEDQRTRRWIRYGVITALVGYAQPVGLLVVAPQALVVLCLPHTLQALRRIAPGPALAAVLIVPLAWLVATAPDPAPSWVQPLNRGQLEQLQELLGGSVAVAAWPLTAAWMVGSVIAGRALLAASPDERWRHSVAILWFWVPITSLIAVSLVEPYFVARYLLAILPASCLLAALALRTLPGAMSAIATGALVLALLVGVVRLWDHPRQDWDAVVDHTTATTPPGLILFADPELRIPYEHALLRADASPWVTPLAPPRSWGGLPRYLPDFSLDDAGPLLAETDLLWVVDWGHEDDSDPFASRVAAVVQHPSIRGAFCPGRVDRFDGTLLVVELVRSTGEPCW